MPDEQMNPLSPARGVLIGLAVSCVFLLGIVLVVLALVG